MNVQNAVFVTPPLPEFKGKQSVWPMVTIYYLLKDFMGTVLFHYRLASAIEKNKYLFRNVLVLPTKFRKVT